MLYQLIQAIVGGCAELGGFGAGALYVNIVNADKLNIFHFGIVLEVIASHNSGADDGNFNRLHFISPLFLLPFPRQAFLLR